MSINLQKHINQIKSGGLVVVIKKLRSVFYLLIQSPLYLFSVPILIIIYLIKPWLLIRWYGLPCSRIAHLAASTALYFCRREAKINQPSQKYIDMFFLKSKYICNKQLIKMLARSLIIFPAFLMIPIFNMNRFFNLFIDSCNQHEIDINPHETRDVHDIMYKMKPHISFNNEEKIMG